MPREIVINRCYGGFGLSPKALFRLRELGQKNALAEVGPGETWPGGTVREGFLATSFCSGIDRDDSLLVQVVRELGTDASGDLAELRIVSIPDGIDWEIEEYDGIEWVAEKHRRWR